ncbi:MAG: transporter [Pseudomonadota bacterium]
MNSIKIAFISAVGLWHTGVAAHSTVSELAELSLQELLEIRVDTPQTDQDATEDSQRWNFSLGWYSQRLDGYRRGTTDFTINEVLFESGEQRVYHNFPVVPTVIEQDVFTASLSYRYSRRSTLSLTVPFVRQATDHVSSVASYEQFMLGTDGIGDVGVSWRNNFYKDDICQFSIGVGLSLPTGSIDEQGDTPREPGNQQLPYTMQLGSGTYDVKIGMGMSWYLGKWTWVSDFGYVHRTNKNDRDYRLGNRFLLGTEMRTAVNKYITAGLGVEYQHSGDINGLDTEITVPGPFPYPASITDPGNFGGQLVRANGSLTLKLTARQSAVITYGSPVYQDLNGIQPKARGRVSASWSISF